jgi:DNA polymerase-3 subunit delta'
MEKAQPKINIIKWPILGHNKIIESLKKNIIKNKLAHAFLFSGPHGVGKMLTALYFVKTIQCQKLNRPCDKCDSCAKINQNTHPDTIILKGETTLKINEIRKLKHKLSLRVSYSGYKTCVIDQAESMTREAANALLKLLEEPSGKTIIILISENCEKILPTIISRCVVVKFFPISLSVIRKNFLDFNLKGEEKFIEGLILASRGRPGFIFECLKNPEKFKERIKIIDEFKKILNSKVTTKNFNRLNYVSNLPLSDRGELKILLNNWLEYLHDLLVNHDIKEYSMDQIKRYILQINKAKFFLAKNVNAKLLMENLVLNL